MAVQSIIHPVHKRPIKLGRSPSIKDGRTLKLSNYIKKLAAPPVKSSFVQKVANWPMYLNDQLGDCVIAAAGHMVQQWTSYAGTETRISDADVLKGYEAVGGYVQGDPSTDNGCSMMVACRYWRKFGFGSHKIVAFVSLDPSKPDEFRQAMHLFGNVYAGFALPVSCQAQIGKLWAVPQNGPVGDGSGGSWGGHCVPLVQYEDFLNLICITWGTTQRLTWNFLEAYCDEAYAIVTRDWIEANGNSPGGFDIKTLLADLAVVVS